MKYLVVSTRYTEHDKYDISSFENMTICGETHEKELAQELMRYYNKTDKGQHCEVHPVMEEGEIADFLWHHDDEYYIKHAVTP